MTRRPIAVCPETEITQAATLMHTRHLRALPVCSGTLVVGILTDRDIVTRHVAAGPGARLVGAIMTPNPQTIASNRPIGWAATLMTRHGIGRLPVCDDGRLLGIVTRGDLARHQIPNTLPGLLVRLAEHTTTRDDSERLDQPGDLLAMLENLQDTRRALLDLEVDLLERRRQLTARLRAPAASDRQRRTLRLVADVAVEPLGSIRPTDPR